MRPDSTLAKPVRAGWDRGSSRGIAPGASFAALRSLKRDLLGELQDGWEQGRPPDVSDLLRRWPVEPRDDPDAASLLAVDFFARRDRGEGPGLDEYSRRFPEHGGSLAGLVSLRSALESMRGPSVPRGHLLRLPDVGDAVFGFRLRRPLGRGAFARVFLAEQEELAGRPVVLKISAIEGSEPQALAQLQHTNIVPIYSAHEDPRAGLRAICMPYFGGASLAQVIERAWADTGRPEHGAQLVAALEAVQAPPVADLARDRAGQDPSGGVAAEPAPLAYLRDLSYVRAAAWIVAQLAEGLEHAHQRGILHRDLKPSNVLLSGEGQPLLLDFNLAHDQHDAPGEAVLGGTIPYMAPEHLRALIDPGRIDRVDRRSDVYSLGMVLAELLTGQSPFEQSGSYSVLPVEIEAMALERARSRPSLRARRPGLPWGLESIARTCLEPDPDRRYQQAEHLADDLRRFLEDRPLRHAPELSRVERARKFFRRHPRLASTLPVVLASVLVLATVAGALARVRSRLTTTADRLEKARAADRLRDHDAGTTRALCLVNTAVDREDHLRRGLAACEATLAVFAPPPGASGPEHPDWARLAPGVRRRVREDRRELLLMLAGARVGLAPDDRGALHRALSLLERAEAIPGLSPSRALWEDRARYLEALGDRAAAEAARKRAATVPAAGARDLYLLATSLARRGTPRDLARAVAVLDQALRRDPRHYWSLMQRGICHLELGDDVAAAGDFGASIGLAPRLPWGYFNRGYVLDRSGRKAEAVADYTAALDRDPNFVPGLLNRGLAQLALKRYAPAEADFRRALHGRDDAVVQAGLGMALEGLGRPEAADAAFAAAFARAAEAPEAERDRLRWTYGFAVSDRRPDRAAEAFAAVLRRHPRHPQALYGRAMLAMRAGRGDAALSDFDRILADDPAALDARRYRAVLLARRGEWSRAGQDINRCLERDPKGGGTLYAGACVAGLAAAAGADPQAADQALALLRRAADRGEPLGRAASDPDLAALRDRPDFRALIAGPTGPDGP